MKIILLLISFVTIPISSLFARPPSEIIIDYRVSERLLIVEVGHPTSNLSRDFIRRIVVTRLGAESQVFYFGKQQDSKKQATQINLEAKPLEEITVEAQCVQGGMRKTRFVVPPEEAELE